jgi:protein tyrosine/serine phosphatase
VFLDDDASPDKLALRWSHYTSEEGAKGFVRAYEDILMGAAETGAYRTIFEHIRDRPSEPFLFHCKAGKDRTGVFAALVLRVAGVTDYDVIGREYELTELGLGKLKEFFIERLAAHPVIGGDRAAAERMITAKAAAMKATMEWLDEAHGGIEGYMKTSLKFTDEDIKKIRKNLIAEEKAIL